MRSGPNKRLWAVAGVTVIAVVAAAVGYAWVRRTAPPWPATVGTGYEIAIGDDGCPVVPPENPPFVDAPGQLVPPGPSEVLLCSESTPDNWAAPVGTGTEGEQRRVEQRVLRAGAADFAAWLNRLPDRNTAWREHQRRWSGWWPDAAPAPYGEVCLMILPAETHSFVLRYPDGRAVPLLLPCGGGVTSGSRTRMNDVKPRAVQEFLRRLGDGAGSRQSR